MENNSVSEIQFSDTFNRLSESATLAMARISRQLKAEGHDVISLSLGEPDFDTPDFIKDAAKKAIDENFTHYPPVNGYADVREAISKKFKRDNDLSYTPDEIVVSTGAKQSIINVVLALISSGDEVILPAPYWVSYTEMVKMGGGTPVVIKTGIENDFKITAEEFESAITDKTKMMIFSSPCNPSGSVYTKEELASIASVLEKHPQIVVISDEIYEIINFTDAHASLASFPQVKDQVVTVNGVSKGFAMTGWRLGYIGAPAKIAKACNKIQGQLTSAPSGISQMAAKAAVEADPSVADYMKASFLKRRELILSLLNDIPGLRTNIPQGAFYVFPEVDSFFGKSYNGTTINNAGDLCEYLLAEEFVALVTGDAFGSPKSIRISYAASEKELIEAAARIKRALAKLQ